MSYQRYSDDNESKRDVPSYIEPQPPLIVRPDMRPRPQKATNLLERFEEDSEIEEPELVQVYLRLKPTIIPNNLYEVRSDRCLVTSLDTATAGHGRRTQHNVSKMYTFSKIFSANCSQKEIFEQVVKENLKKLPDGHNFTLLTYGASGSGKTYTLMGNVNSPGLVPRSLEYVFRLVDAAQQPSYKPTENGPEKLSYAKQEYELQWMKRLQNVSAPVRDRYRRMSTQLHNDLAASTMDLTNRTRYYVWVSFVEIYNEAIYDLLAPPEKRTKLRIREDSSGNVYVKGATYAFVRSGEEAYDVMVAGKHNLIYAATGVHAHSSRSHCIFTINMLTETEGEVRSSFIRLCDLAGCERARATRNTGARMQESRAINSSLHVLERCLHMLRRKQRQRQEALVPYRESKLTRLIGSGLSGSRGEAVSMVVTLNPSPEYAHETKHVLGLAAVAQDIQINHTMVGSTLSLESSTQDTTMETSAEVMRLRADNERLHFELAQLQRRFRESQLESAETMKEVVEEARDISRQYYESVIQALKSEKDDMKEEYERELANLSVQLANLSAQLADLSAPSSGPGTPSRFLQSKVTQPMGDITVLEEKLKSERLARDRAEKEVQRLRNYIEERDEKSFKDNVDEKPENVISLNSSDSEDDINNPFNESLESLLTEEHLNTTQALYIDNNKKQSSDESGISDNDKNDDNDSDLEKLDNTLKEDETIDDITSSICITGDEREVSKQIEDTNESITNVNNTNNVIGEDNELFYNNKKRMTCNDMTNVQDIEKTINIELNIKTRQGQISENNNDFHSSNNIIVDDKVAQLNDSFETNKLSSNSRETYFVKTAKNACNNIQDFKATVQRGTYFVEDTYNDTDSNHFHVKMEVTEPYFVKETEEYVDENKQTIFKKEIGEISKKSEFNEVKECGETCFPRDTEHVTNINNLKQNNNTINKELEKESSLNAENYPENDKDTKVSEMVSETLINKIIKSIKKTQSSDSSLRQFEQLEMAAKTCGNDVENGTKEFGASQIIKNEKKYFDSSKIASNDFSVKNVNNEKRTYFDNIDVNIESYFNKKLTATHPSNDDTRSPSIVKDEISKDVGPSTIKQLLGESFGKNPDVISSINKNKLLIKKPDSIDIFESPHNLNKANEKLNNAEIVQSIEKISTIEHKPTIAMQNEAKVEPRLSFKIPLQESNTNDQNHQQSESMTTVDKTIDEFENIYKNITVPRATEFELLVSQEIKSCDVTQNEVKPEQEGFESLDDTRYNLRRKAKLLKKQTANTQIEEILAESSYASCATQIKPTKRNLRLRRRKNLTEDEKSDQEIKDNKLKDIVNLQREFSDVTMNVPASVKNVTVDIPSPKKMDGEENVSPLQGIQSCPSKIAPRSRRKLFTPRVEPLEESLSQTGDSNERIYVPRPSYHRGRARRKL